MSKRSPKISGPVEFEPSASKMPSGLLEAAVQATQTGSPCFATMDEIAPLLVTPAGQLVEYNEAMTDDYGRIALRATAAGVQVFQANGNGVMSPVDPWAVGRLDGLGPLVPYPLESPLASPPVVGSHTATTSRPVFDKGIPFPGKNKRTRSSHYNFDEMEVGDSFITLPTGDNPEPWKRLVSAASAASKRFEPKTFETLALEENGVKFARTWRTA